jgi:prolyl oligopeptidase
MPRFRKLRPLVAFVFAAAWPAFAADPPVARKVDVVDRDFGLSMPDPYRWMEGEGNAELNDWLRAQGAASRAKLDALPTLPAWRERLGKAASAGTSHFGHALVGGRLFFLRAEAGKEGVLMLREADGRERVLFDPNAEGKGGDISGFSVSPDAGKVAVNVGYGGDEIGEIALFDAATGRRFADAPKPVWSEFRASWLPDSSGFFYTRMRDAKSGDADPVQGMGAYLHELGRPQSADRPIAQAGADDALKIAAHDFPVVIVTPGSDWAELSIGGASPAVRYCFAPLADAAAAHATWRCLTDDADDVQAAGLHGDTLYLLSAKDAPNRKVLALDLRDPEATLADAETVVPERADIVLTGDATDGLRIAGDGLYLQSARHGLGRIERLDYASNALAQVPLPGEGTALLVDSDPRRPGALLSLDGWTTPLKVYRYDGKALADTKLGKRGFPAHPDLVAEEVEVASADGTRVPMSIVRRRDLKLDGHARAIVYGYGGYGVSIEASYSALRSEWSQAGNVLAVCHVRGGGENGDAWRIGGTGPNKQRGIEDFIACARELARRGYGAPSRTAGFGASMGGILTGGAYTTSPETWGAMVVQSGIFNPVRLLAAKNGANQIDEMGDPRTEAGMKQLLAMDPYQHVRDGVRYPPLLLVTGAVDQRVAPWNSAKFGARVAAASPATPVWFRTDDQFGHFATNANAQALEYADVFAFLDAMLK